MEPLTIYVTPTSEITFIDSSSRPETTYAVRQNRHSQPFSGVSNAINVLPYHIFFSQGSTQELLVSTLEEKKCHLKCLLPNLNGLMFSERQFTNPKYFQTQETNKSPSTVEVLRPQNKSPSAPSKYHYSASEKNVVQPDCFGQNFACPFHGHLYCARHNPIFFPKNMSQRLLQPLNRPMAMLPMP